MLAQHVRRRFWGGHIFGQHKNKTLPYLQDWLQKNVVTQFCAEYHYSESLQTAPQVQEDLYDDLQFEKQQLNIQNKPVPNYGELLGILNNRLEQQTKDFSESLQFFHEDTLEGQSLQIDLNGDVNHHPNYSRQIELETRALQETVDEYACQLQSSKDRKDGTSLPAFQRIVRQWVPPLSQLLTTEQDKITSSICDDDISEFAPYLMLLSPDQLAVITVNQVLTQIFPSTIQRKKDAAKNNYADADCIMPLTRVANRVGGAVMAQVNYYKMVQKYKQGMKTIRKIKQQVNNKVMDKLELSRQMEDFRERMGLVSLRWNIQNTGLTDVQKSAKRVLGEDIESWGKVSVMKLGVFLIERFLQIATIKEADIPTQAISYQIRKKSKGKRSYKKVGCLIYHDELIQQVLDINRVDSNFLLQKYYPMLMPPLPWTAYNQGGHITQRTTAVRLMPGQSIQLEMLKESHPTYVYQALDYLGQQGWRINKPVLDVINKIFERGGGIAKIPTKKIFPYPDKPPQLFRARITQKKIKGTNIYIPIMEVGNMEQNIADLWQWRRQYNKIRNKNIQNHSLRCDLNLKISIAQECKSEPAIYYPHNLDFRGRAYPLHPHLNHMGGDFSRGLLLFSEGKPLGERGLFWLKVHLANCKGKPVDKLPMEERAQFADENLSKIIESASNPLGGDMWWAKAEKPFQFLATCIELRDALESANLCEFKSCLPVHQDGSCNGLQHYAALGRDRKGAELVNLTPGERPSDPYTAIATQLKQLVEKQAEEGVKEAKLVLPFIDRKMVKQTVMTSVYGVTFIGAREQIQNRLEEKGMTDQDTLRSCSRYAAIHTMSCMMNMFTGAKEIMQWLKSCAQKIGATNETIIWHTPLDLPVSQPYFKETNMTIKTVLQSVVLRSTSDKGMPPKKAKQRSAFPPNYIHSIDGSHMLLTAHECGKNGMGFAAVHDSFWTHAATVDEMNKILRDQFVKLHSRDLLQELLNDFRERYPSVEFDEVPDIPNDLDLNDVTKSVYFFS
eukprot:TRINITY_DN6357_c0_g3_i1.p1 TRINITY_DN6357_c0_g3~~TRINITY_DN6357_c0_g3_i1.p1  ORF type:complete len:1012 (-),score=142.80 TRINITY_DN6357_c0_g3_i1:272-3307(-)